MDYFTVDNHFPMYGVFQSPLNGCLRLDNTQDFIEESLNREKRAPVADEFLSESLTVTKGLKALENKHQGNPSLNVKLDTMQSVGGGKLFRVKPKAFRSKYL
jgi:hypothetical protein